VDWSIVRMGMPSRLGLALTVSAILWLTIWLALR